MHVFESWRSCLVSELSRFQIVVKDIDSAVEALLRPTLSNKHYIAAVTNAFLPFPQTPASDTALRFTAAILNSFAFFLQRNTGCRKFRKVTKWPKCLFSLRVKWMKSLFKKKEIEPTTHLHYRISLKEFISKSTQLYERVVTVKTLNPLLSLSINADLSQLKWQSIGLYSRLECIT